MATMVTGTKTLPKKGTTGGTKAPGPNGRGPRNGNGHGSFSEFDWASRYRIGMWVAMAAIVMMFTALSSAYIVRSASSSDWQHLKMPGILWLSSTLILISSGTMEAARRRLRSGFTGQYSKWLFGTILLGLAFLGSQLLAWRQLVHEGVYLATNPHSSFFYLLTATHAVHLLGGLLALAYLFVRVSWRAAAQNELRRLAAADAVTLYWHFMDGLWIYLFLLLFLWR